MIDCCPHKFPSIAHHSFVAPFWADVNIDNTDVVGEVSYEAHDSSTGGDLLDEVSSFVSEEEGVQFSGTWMLVAEWSNVPEWGQPVIVVGKRDMIYKVSLTSLLKLVN